MKKFKWFTSFYKERDWLEEMARQGWLLTNITMAGTLYHFTECEPCEKVYEVERFAISAQPTVGELNARRFAMDVATQSGWDMVTNDLDMNYYFVKDKAGDETDEFYDDPELRQERAERYRNHMCYDVTVIAITSSLILTILYICLVYFCNLSANALAGLFKLYLIINLIDFITLIYQMRLGQKLSQEFLMSREEWAVYRENSVKKKFNKVQQLRSFLQEQSESGWALSDYKNGHFLFQKDSRRYNYFVDTKKSLQKRMKDNAIELNDSKDLLSQGLKWYEISIAEAAKHDLKPVAVMNRNILIYKRPYSEENLPWENGNETIGAKGLPLKLIMFFIACFLIGYLIGLVIALFI